ncbi:MAG: hypothetical protein V3U82_05925 [Robiginitomaculum sp.]
MLSFIAAGLHLACLVGGPEWLRFFGAGERIAGMAERGSWYPGVVTLIIATALMVWGMYAIVGAAAMDSDSVALNLPFLKWILVAITAVYLARGALPFIAAIFKPEILVPFTVWSSVICLIYGAFHLVGLWQVWAKI